MAHASWMEDQSALRSDSHLEQRSYLRRLHSVICCLEGALRSSEDARARHSGSLRSCSPPSVRRLYSHHARLSISVAYDHHPDNVSYSSNDVRQARAPGRKRGVNRVWRAIQALHDFYAGVFPAIWCHSRETGNVRREAAQSYEANNEQSRTW